MADKTVTFHYPPTEVREYVKNWIADLDKKKSTKPETKAVMEDIYQLIDIAIGVLKPGPADDKGNQPS